MKTPAQKYRSASAYFTALAIVVLVVGAWCIAWWLGWLVLSALLIFLAISALSLAKDEEKKLNVTPQPRPGRDA